MNAAVVAKPVWRLPHDKRDARAEMFRQRLLSAGATLETLPSGATRIVAGNSYMTVANLADLLEKDLDKLGA